ncbi:MAG TPA: hypothetical protein VFY14_19430, partial [Streptomyces sp.]|nr:hypothetical protein [Streptomyces sp.]
MTAPAAPAAVPAPGTAADDDMWAGMAATANRPSPSAPADLESERPRVEIDSEPAGILRVSDAIEAGHIPETYVRQGSLVQVVEVSGDTDAEAGVGHAITPVTPDSLRRLLAVHADVVTPKRNREGEVRWVPFSPTVGVCRAVLSRTHWDSVPPLAGL